MKAKHREFWNYYRIWLDMNSCLRLIYGLVHCIWFLKFSNQTQLALEELTLPQFLT